ncbi:MULTISPECIES: homocysteine S-methyltransferase [unclassified Rathayibacter]|uniref:homocysteine S-methyltransferase n=1 Tax=unclassified Rathayibacter TaxID=2609250 RepID=UPI000CE8CC69|nr:MULTISPECIES: homocysteine S-methyltransferase [unclassified Rathayibacter]PPI37765.1 homocysteine S-methyltransferase [Rathayibacter sp. RFBD1]PPI56882.1 homocysteine S-methyltransferase [Rathayibacter sp. TRS19]
MTAGLVATARVRPLLLDGGLGTELEAQGAAVDSSLWSARVLLEEPGRVVAAHRAFAEAGARVAVTASYQVSASGFAAAGLAPGLAERALRESVDLARRAQSGWVAAAVGPYGASLGDGSEYRGDDGLTVGELAAWHRPRLETLAAAGPDLLAVETIPSVREVRAVVEALAGSSVPAWICVSGRSGRTAAGEPLAEALAVAAASEEVVGVGVNCCPPGDVAEAVRIARSVTGKLVVVYPNSGEEWDAVERRWAGDAAFDPALVASWRAAGADLIGGCCRVGPAAIAALGRSLEEES